MEEDWKDVVGFEEYFKISNTGRVFSKRTSKILKQTISRTGYWSVSTRIGGRLGKCFCFKVHRLVAEAFLEKPSQELVEASNSTFYKKILVNHLDGNKLNNVSSNLEWCSYKENSEHAVASGLHGTLNKLGLENKNFKLTKEQVSWILEVYIKRDREFGARALARKLGVSHRSVGLVIKLYYQ